jgi:pilus assembly protein CpaE
MPSDVRFITYSADEAFLASLRQTLLGLGNVKIVAEVDEAALLSQAVTQFPIDVLFINLDPSPETLLPLVGEVIGQNREMAVFVASESTDGQLILKSMRLGVREFVPTPIDPHGLKEAIDRVSVDRSQTHKQGRLINVVGAAGGMGATLIATNLAVELAALTTGQVTMADLDYRFGQVATMMDVDPRYTLADLCATPEALEPQVINRALQKHPTGVYILGRPNHLAEADTITAASCVGVLSSLVELNEYVVADGPMRFDGGCRSVLALSDLTLLIVQQSVPCVRSALRIIDSLRESGFNLDRAKLVCNRAGRGVGHLSLNDVTTTLGLPLYATLPDDWEAASSAINLGEPLTTHRPKSKLRLAIQEIAERIHTPPVSSSDDKDARKSGLIGRIFASS